MRSAIPSGEEGMLMRQTDKCLNFFFGSLRSTLRTLSTSAMVSLVLVNASFAGSSSQGLAMQLYSNAFANNGIIPRQYTCEGADLSPLLRWEHLPTGTRSLALIVEDPDAPDPAVPQRIWVHWVLYDIPPTLSELPAGLQQLPPGTREGINDWQRTGYGGPCPPIGRHRYFFRLYALNTVLPDLQHPDKTQLQTAMRGHLLAETALVGLYAKGDH